MLFIKLVVATSSVAALSWPAFPTSCEPFDEPIDFVYTWVNGSDPDFVDEITKYKQQEGIEDVSFENERQSNNRYADFDQIKYSIRSVEKYAPWVNHIYIVTNGQVPTWLNTNHPDITIVTHAEIWRYPEHLPNFQSGAIEANLHRIEGLTDKFVYFNDDFGLIAETCPSDFYTKEDGYKLYAERKTHKCSKSCPNELLRDGVCNDECNLPTCAFDAGDCIDDKDKVLPIYPDDYKVHNGKQQTSLLELTRLFGGRDRYKRPHEPIMIDRDIMEEMQQQMMPIIANMSSHRFRDNHDIQYQFTYDNYLRDKMNEDDGNDKSKYKYVNLFHEDGRKDAHINLNNENGMDGPKRQIDRVFRDLANPDGHSFLFMCVQDKINHE